MYKLKNVKSVDFHDNDIIKASDFLHSIGYDKSDNHYKNSLKKLNENQKNIKSVRAYNVGHGNMNTIHYEDESVLLYDQGSIHQRNIVYTDYNPNNVKIIIVSHCHLDHYNLMINVTFSNLNTIIIPDDYIPSRLSLLIANNSTSTTIIVLPLSRPRSIRFHGELFDNHFLYKT